MLLKMERSFPKALALLKNRSRPRSTSIVPSSLPKVVLPNGEFVGRGMPPVYRMRDWLHQIGHTDDALDRLNIIHVAGTKGKGSTCAFIESLLRAHGKRTFFPRKTGLYTSPHLMSITERIRINFEPLSEELFAKYVFEVYDALLLHPQDEGPGFLQLLALISFHAFICEEVDVAIYETHHGGEYCATNVIREPIVTAITNIGLDHINVLGSTVEDIAWHKAGILKTGATAFTVPQEPSVLSVLQCRAEQKRVNLEVVQSDPKLPNAFADPVQRLNCTLARAAADAFLQRVMPGSRCLSQQDIIDGIRQFSWPGRFQIRRDLNCTWFLDVAHNEMSIGYAAKWFQRVSSERASPSIPRVVIFSHMCTLKRDFRGIVKSLALSLEISLECIVFSTDYLTKADFSVEDDEVLSQYSQIWRSMRSGDERIYKAETIGKAIDLARDMGTEERDIHILVTGSLFLVGGALQLKLQPSV